jgi:phosphatidylglycerol lysyltransferase
VTVNEWPGAAAEGHAALERCLTEWLDTRGLPPLHFLVEPETLRNLADRRVFVAEREGRPVAFLVASPIPQRQGWLIEQFVRGRNSTNGTAELMIDAAVRSLAASGASYVTLGLAPLSRRAGEESDQSGLVRWSMRWARAHGRRFYNFDGLDAFKAKFNPERWEAVYAISNEARFSLRSLYAIASAFSAGSPILLLFRAIVRAASQEIRWIRGAPRAKH